MRLYFELDDNKQDIKLGLDYYRHHDGHPWKAVSINLIGFSKVFDITLVWKNHKEYEHLIRDAQ